MNADVDEVLVARQQLSRWGAGIVFLFRHPADGHAPYGGDRHALDAVDPPRQADPQPWPRLGHDPPETLHDRPFLGTNLMQSREKVHGESEHQDVFEYLHSFASRLGESGYFFGALGGFNINSNNSCLLDSNSTSRLSPRMLW